MSGTRRMTRRTVLRGLGTALALPWLEALGPARAGGPSAVPRRLAIVYVPNGVHMPDWTPADTGAAYTLPRTLQPLRPFRDDLLVLSGLAAHRADGPSGNHARALAVFLTGRRPPDDGSVRLGASADQRAAAVAGRHTRLPSLELGCEPAAQAGHCDTPYSCAYTSNIAWKSETTPLPPEVNPAAVFDRLFAGGKPEEADEARTRRALSRRSVLDFVAEDAQALRSRLGGADRRKLDEYLAAVREVETRLGRTDTARQTPDRPRPSGVPADYREHLRLQCDLLALAFRADVTRVATFLFANEFSNRPYPFAGAPEGHHDLSHHENRPDKQAKLAAINRFHVEQFAYLLGRLREVKEGDGTLLDSCLIAYGCGNSDGNRHNHDDLPILLAGRGGGTVQPGRHVRYKEGTPLMNLWLALLERLGAPAEPLGDGTGALPSLSG